MLEPTDDELRRALEHADAKLIEQGVPIPLRHTAALALLWPDEVFPVVPREAAEKAGGAARSKVSLVTDLERVPILIRNEVFLARIPLAYGSPTMQPLDMIGGLTEDLRKSLRPHESKAIRTTYAEGLALVYELDDARPGLAQGPVAPEVEELLAKGVKDRMAAAKCFEDRHDANGACFHSQQHAEKLMKVLLVHKGGRTDQELKRLSHNLRKLLRECRSIDPAMASVESDVETVAEVTMEYRYTKPAVAIQQACGVFWAALRVGAAAACGAFGLDRRGGEMRFIAPRGYEERLAKKRRQVVSEQWPHIVENHRVAREAWGNDVTVLVLDLRDEWARGIATTLRQPVESPLAELDAPGGHLKSGYLMFGLPREDAMRHVAFNRGTPVQGFDGPAPEGSIMVAFVSDEGYEAFCVSQDRTAGPSRPGGGT